MFCSLRKAAETESSGLRIRRESVATDGNQNIKILIPALSCVQQSNGGRLHRALVLENKALVGSVNSYVPQFERATDTLADYPDWLTDAIITDVFDPAEIDAAFETGDEHIKTVVEFGTR